MQGDHRDAGLHVRLAIGVARIGQPEGIDFDQNGMPAPQLRHRLRLDRVEDRKLLHRETEKDLQILRRKLEEGEVIALEILQHREGERCLRGMTQGGSSSIHRST